MGEKILKVLVSSVMVLQVLLMPLVANAAEISDEEMVETPIIEEIEYDITVTAVSEFSNTGFDDAAFQSLLDEGVAVGEWIDLMPFFRLGEVGNPGAAWLMITQLTNYIEIIRSEEAGILPDDNFGMSQMRFTEPGTYNFRFGLGPDGTHITGVFTVVVRATDSCPVIVEGQFASQAGASGISGSHWRICEDGTLEIDGGFINWTLYTGPWHAYRNEITHIVITGPVTVGASLRSLFRDLNQVTEIEGLAYLDTSRTTNMENLFRNASALTAVDLSTFDTSRVTNMTRMFTNTR